MASHHSHTSVVGNGWRVKLYELEPDGAWIDKGTGYVACRILPGLGCPGLIVTNETNTSEVLLKSRIRFDENYELQGENIIMWRELNENNTHDTDYALSFQEAVGCNQIWEAISEIQNQSGEGIVRHTSEGHENSHMMNVEDLYSNTSSPAAGPQPYIVLPPQCTTLESLTLARDKLNNMFPGQRDYAIAQLMEQDFQYVQDLFAMFTAFEESNNSEGLSRMAEVFRSICLLNDSGLLEYFFSSDEILTRVVHVFEYDHTLQTRGQYREYLFHLATLKEVVPHSSPEMTQAMTSLFRLKYFRDIILHPAVDEPGISALSSMITFSSSEICYKLFENSAYLSRILKVIKPSLDITPYYNEDMRPNSTSHTEELTRVNTSVTTLSDAAVIVASGPGESSENSSLQCEVHASGEDSDGSSSSSSSGLSDSSESDEGAVQPDTSNINNSSTSSSSSAMDVSVKKPTIVPLSVEAVAANNRQLSPRSSKDLVLRFPNPIQSSSVAKCLSMDEDSVHSTATDIIATPQLRQAIQSTSTLPRSSPVDAARFLRELFFLSKSLIMEKRSELFRMFFETLKRPFLEVLLFIFGYNINHAGYVCASCDVMTESDVAVCHSLLCEVLAGIVVVCPSQIRKIILAEAVVVVPLINTALSLREVTKVSYHHSLLFLMLDVVVNSNDAASIDQMGDSLKTLLDHDKTPGVTPGPPNAPEPNLSKAQLLQLAQENSEKDALIALYYEHYVTWVFAPFQDENGPDRCVPDSFYASRGLEIRHPRQMGSALVASRRMIFENLIQGIIQHSYRMKYYIMRNAGIISKCLTKVFSKEICNANKWLHVYASKFIRAILATKDEFYVKHIEKTDLLRPLLTHLKTSRCKDNMFTSCIYELVDYIRLQNIRLLILYIVNKFGDCFTESKSNVYDQLKIRYDQIMNGKDEPPSSDSSLDSGNTGGAIVSSSYSTVLDRPTNLHNPMKVAELKARQKRLREADSEDDYFFGEDDDDSIPSSSTSPSSTQQSAYRQNLADKMKLSTTAALAASKLKVTAEDRAKLVIVGSQKPIYGHTDRSNGKGNLYSSNRILGGHSGTASANSSSSSSSGATSRNFNAGMPVHGSNGRHSPYRMTGSLSTEEEEEQRQQGHEVVGDEDDDGEDAWFSMHPTPCSTSSARSANADHGTAGAVNDENASVASSVGNNKRQKANDGSAIAGNTDSVVSRSPLSPLGDDHSGQSGASALFSMLSEYGNNDEVESSGTGTSGSGGVLRPVPARTHRSLIVGIYDDAMTSLRKDSMSNDSVIGRLERGIDLRSARSDVSVTFFDAEDSLMTQEPSDAEHHSPDRSGLPPLRSKFGDDDDDDDAAVFAGRLKRPAVTSPGGTVSSGGGSSSVSKNHSLLSGSKQKPRHSVIQFKTTSLGPSSDNKDNNSGSGGSSTASSVAVGGSGENHE